MLPADLGVLVQDVNKQMQEVEGRSPGDPSVLASKMTGRHQSSQHAHRLSLAKRLGGLRSQTSPGSLRIPEQSSGDCLDRHLVPFPSTQSLTRRMECTINRLFMDASGAPLGSLMRAGSSIPPVIGRTKIDGPLEQTILRKLSAIGEADCESSETDDIFPGIKDGTHQVTTHPVIASMHCYPSFCCSTDPGTARIYTS